MTFKEFCEAHRIAVAECTHTGHEDSKGQGYSVRHYNYSLSLRRGEPSPVETRIGVHQYGIGEGILEQWARDTNAIAPRATPRDHDAVRYGKHLEASGYRSVRGAAGRAYLDAVARQYQPEVTDVLQCLTSDAQSAQNAGSFEEWARDFGYDPDSRKAEKAYRGCVDQALALQRWLGLELYQQLLACEE